ncbi:hypothetical protein H8E52_03605 [bacterium]|nr:hypothetical protein [bacterium]
MKKMLVLSMVAVLAFSSFAMAQIDPDDDGMGIYFDTGATIFCVETIGSYQPITAYLVVTNHSVAEPAILGWEARLEIDGNPMVAIPSSWNLTSGALNVGSGDDYICGTTNPPLAFTGTATVLADITLTFIGYEVGPYANFSVGRATGSLTYPDGGGYASQVGFPTPCQHIFGAWGTPSAWVNGGENCDIIANEEMTWGSVKTLY